MSKYKAIITTAGAAKIAAATAGGTQLKINRMAVGDGNGSLPTPNPAQTELVNEKYRAALNGLTIGTVKNNIVAEMIIPADVGGFWLREMGLYDEAGTLIAVANMAESYKPQLAEGSGRTQTLRMILIVSSMEAIQVIAGGDTVLATKDFVTDAISAHEKTRNHPDASTTAKGLVQLSSATTSTDETKAATPKAVKVVSDASVKKAANLSDLADKAAARGNLALGNAATKNVGSESGQVMGVGAFGLGMGSRHRDDAYCNLGEIYRVNNTSANAPGNGVYGVISLPCDGGPSTGYLSVSNAGAGFLGSSNSTSGIKWSRIYSTDNKPTAADVGAWSKSEADSRYTQRANNLSDLPDKAKARQALALKSAAQRDVGEASGQVLTADQAFGLGLSPAARRHALADIWGKGAFTGFTWAEGNDPDMPPIVSTGSSVGIINHTWQVSAGGEYFGMQIGWRQGRMSFRTKEAGKGIDGWFEFLHSGNGYTAKECDAKYALRSLKINGKPLSGDVNLLASDVNAWNKTEADGRYLLLSGGTVKKLAIKSGSTAPEGESLRIEGGAHTPFVMSRLSAQGNLSMGFQLAGRPLMRLGMGVDDELHWGTDANQGGNPRIYTTAKPPTAQETGALTDADAMKKYAVRSLKINGKPLSGDINLLAGDVNAWNKTEADGRYVKQSGDTMTGALTTKQGFRADKNVSVGEDLWVDRNATVAGSLKVGASTHASDGNIWGTRWNANGQWLWDAVIEQVSGRVDWAYFNEHVGARATIDWVNANFARKVPDYTEVGSYIYARSDNGSDIWPNTVVSGSTLHAATGDGAIIGDALPGSWRSMGYSTRTNDAHRATLWMRVS
ncbi:MAG: phage tail protein [Serratia inhibens]|uniref:phage tail protein n=1 Tax=Serratia inhibens TaxID=2338073 RepID=UPI003C7C8ED8